MTYACIKCGVELDDFMGRETWSKTRAGSYCPRHFGEWQQRQERQAQEKTRAWLARLDKKFPGIDVLNREGR